MRLPIAALLLLPSIIPAEEWPRDAEGHMALGNRQLDLAGLRRAGLDEVAAT